MSIRAKVQDHNDDFWNEFEANTSNPRAKINSKAKPVDKSSPVKVINSAAASKKKTAAASLPAIKAKKISSMSE